MWWDKTLKNIHIELISNCNLNCRFCGISHRQPQEMMSVDTFKKIILQCYDAGINSIRLSPLTGELMLYPHLYECFDFLESQNHIHQYGFYTNFSTPNIDVDRLISYRKLKDIVISINGNDKEEYEYLTQSSCFDTYYENLLKLKHTRYNTLFRFEIKSKHWYSMQPMRGLIFQLLFLLISKYGYSQIQESQLDNWAGYFQDQSIEFESLFLKKQTNQTPCPVLHSKNIILSDGSYLLCGCRDINKETYIGNIHNTPITELEFQKLLAGTPELCKKCTG